MRIKFSLTEHIYEPSRERRTVGVPSNTTFIETKNQRMSSSAERQFNILLHTMRQRWMSSSWIMRHEISTWGDNDNTSGASRQMTICEIKVKRNKNIKFNLGSKSNLCQSTLTVESHSKSCSDFSFPNTLLGSRRSPALCAFRVYAMLSAACQPTELFGNVNFMLCIDKARPATQKLQRKIGINSHWNRFN